MSHIHINFEHVNYSYEKTVPILQDITFTAHENDSNGDIGANGVGKSTLLKAAMGLLGSSGMVTRGDIWYKGRNLPDLPARALRKLNGPELGMIFQSAGSSFCPIRTVGAQLYEIMTQHGSVAKKEFESCALELLEKLGLEDGRRILRSYPFELSGGQKRRVAIAGVLAMEPQVLILDEPTAGLDPKGRDEILDQIAYLHKKRNLTVILVSHSMDDIAKYADRIIVMNQGEVMYNDVPKKVFAHYKELEQVGLAAPQVTYIMHELKAHGLNVNTEATTIEEAADSIMEVMAHD